MCVLYGEVIGSVRTLLKSGPRSGTTLAFCSVRNLLGNARPTPGYRNTRHFALRKYHATCMADNRRDRKRGGGGEGRRMANAGTSPPFLGALPAAPGSARSPGRGGRRSAQGAGGGRGGGQHHVAAAPRPPALELRGGGGFRGAAGPGEPPPLPSAWSRGRPAPPPPR